MSHIKYAQGIQRSSHGKRANYYHKTQDRNSLLIRKPMGKALSIPLPSRTQAVFGHHEDISIRNRMNGGMSTFPQGIQDKIISFPQGSQGAFSRVPVLTTKENDILQEIIVVQEGKGEIIDFPEGMVCLSHGTSSLERTEDIIIVHQGTPEDLISVVQET